MTGAIVAAVAAVLLFAALAPRLGRRLPPRAATRMLVPACVALTATTALVLAVTALTWLGQFPLVSAIGRWSARRLTAADPVPPVAAAAGSAVLAVLAVRFVVLAVRRVRALAPVLRANREARSGPGVVVLDSDRIDAFATPAPHGQVVVTSALLGALSPAERRAVLAHERSHVTGRHAWWVLAADLAAAANPLLRPTATAVGQAVERWADEDAADRVGDRALVAQAIARTALLRQDAGHRAAVLPDATGGDVPDRVRALLAPPPPRRPGTRAALVALLLVATLTSAAVERTGDHLFDHAGSRHGEHSAARG
jgi:beta-lactamase regulating signal transducer with metallopeptidase domain